MIGLWTSEWAKKNSIEFTYFPDMDSSNKYAKENFDSIKYPHLILTDMQTTGVGRGENKWLPAKNGDALYSTWCFSLNEAPSPITTARIGLALYDSLVSSFSKENLSIKAPNDIYLGEKKLAGILCESIAMDKHYLFIGIGLNVLSSPKELSTSTHLSEKISQEEWSKFLSLFYQKISNMNFTEKLLSSIEQSRLSFALKKYPLWEEEFVDLYLDGSLQFEEHVVQWMDL